MPHIEQTSVRAGKGPDGYERYEHRFKMSDEDVRKWKLREKQLVEAALKIRLIYGIRHGITGSLPPRPSEFHYDRLHRSAAVARRMIIMSRDWFAVWMGFTSYLISQAKDLPLIASPNPPPGFPAELPSWYWYLSASMSYKPSWLDGLLASTVADFSCARAGVLYRFSDIATERPSPDFFISHNIPIWFPWTAVEESATDRHPELRRFVPPPSKIQDALTFMFRSPNPTFFRETIIRHFCKADDGPFSICNEVLKQRQVASHVWEFFRAKYPGHLCIGPITHAAIATHTYAASEQVINDATNAIALPEQTMLEGVEAEDRGIVCSHPNDFIASRNKRQREVLESQQDIQRRLSREKNPPTKNTTMYEWQKHTLVRGQTVFVRVRVNKRSNESTYAVYRTNERIYNAMSNEWDFSEQFAPVGDSGSHADDNTGSDESCDGDDNCIFQTACSPQPVFQPDLIEDQEPQTSVDYSPPRIPWSCDVLQTMAWVYGFVPVLHAAAVKPPNSTQWEQLLKAVGFADAKSVPDIDEANQTAIWQFFSDMVSKKLPSSDLYDLVDTNRAALTHILDFQKIHRPSSEMFIFSTPVSDVCDWVLGVESATAALYISRCIFALCSDATSFSTPGMTIFGIAAHLLERGIPFRTLLPLSVSSLNSTVLRDYKPSRFRHLEHMFDVGDFEEAMMQCKVLLTSSCGRAAMLKGGIVGRIAKEYLSVDSVLHGPSVEITTHCVGYFGPVASGDKRYCDDELTAHEIAVICGTYTIYTGQSFYIQVYLVNIQLSSTLGTVAGQTTVRSWFPPPSAWIKNGAGYRWLEWTERSEKFFVKLLEDIKKGQSQPLSIVDWRSRLRGLKLTRDLLDYSEKQACQFMDKHLPVQN